MVSQLGTQQTCKKLVKRSIDISFISSDLQIVEKIEVLTKKRRLKCWRKDESDIRGTVLSTTASVRTSAFQQVFLTPQELLSCTTSPGS